MSSPFEQSLAAIAAAAETRLAALLDDAVREGEIARPARLMAAMRHGALGGGKRLRPFLTVAAARACGGDETAALAAGCAIELVHCYSLIHDDLPAMDDDDVRRGRPTVHRAFDEATAILAGDGLLTLAFEVLASPETQEDAAIRAELVLCLARAAGLGGMVGGQMLDLAAEGRFEGAPSPQLGPDAIRRLQSMKTGAILRASVEMGALAAAASRPQREALVRYGLAVGAAFQIADDILDVEASPETLGKATAKDAARGKGTLVQALGLEGARSERDALVQAAISALGDFGAEADDLREAARFVAHRRH